MILCIHRSFDFSFLRIDDLTKKLSGPSKHHISSKPFFSVGIVVKAKSFQSSDNLTQSEPTPSAHQQKIEKPRHQRPLSVGCSNNLTMDQADVLTSPRLCASLLKSATQPNLASRTYESFKEKQRATFESAAKNSTTTNTLDNMNNKQPIPKSNSIADRLAALQRNGDCDWLKRAERTSEFAARRSSTVMSDEVMKSTPKVNINNNLISSVNCGKSSENLYKDTPPSKHIIDPPPPSIPPVKMREKREPRPTPAKRSSIADRLSMLEDSAKNWKSNKDGGEGDKPSIADRLSGRRVIQPTLPSTQTSFNNDKTSNNSNNIGNNTESNDAPKKLTLPTHLLQPTMKSASSANVARIIKNAVPVFPFQMSTPPTQRPLTISKSTGSSSNGSPNESGSATDSESDTEEVDIDNSRIKKEAKAFLKPNQIAQNAAAQAACLLSLRKSQSACITSKLVSLQAKQKPTVPSKVFIPRIDDDDFDSFFSKDLSNITKPPKLINSASASHVSSFVLTSSSSRFENLSCDANEVTDAKLNEVEKSASDL